MRAVPLNTASRVRPLLIGPRRNRRSARAHRPRTQPAFRSPTFHVVVGTNYGSHVVHETKHYIFFAIAHLYFLVFRSG